MTATYDPTLPADKDTVRFLVGDTDTSNAAVSDEEITASLALFGSVYNTAAGVADALAAKYSSSTSISISGLVSVAQEQKALAYRALAVRLRSQAATMNVGAPFVGGVSIAAMDAVQDDTDRVPNQFEVGQFDYPGTSLPTADSDSDGV